MITCKTMLSRVTVTLRQPCTDDAEPPILHAHSPYVLSSLLLRLPFPAPCLLCSTEKLSADC
jgi:hypothetical protein